MSDFAAAIEQRNRARAECKRLAAELERVTAALREIERTAAGEADAPLRDFASATLAGGARAAQEPDVTTFQWLIERGQPEGLERPVWLEHSAKHPARAVSWTTNAWDAAMFPDLVTASTYIMAHGLNARAVEHGFAARAAQEDK
jgi:hypothetical protein